MTAHVGNEPDLAKGAGRLCGPGRTRTGHLPLARRVLYPMSYEPRWCVRTRSAIRTRTVAVLSGVPPAVGLPGPAVVPVEAERAGALAGLRWSRPASPAWWAEPARWRPPLRHGPASRGRAAEQPVGIEPTSPRWKRGVSAEFTRAACRASPVRGSNPVCRIESPGVYLPQPHGRYRMTVAVELSENGALNRRARREGMGVRKSRPTLGTGWAATTQVASVAWSTRSGREPGKQRARGAQLLQLPRCACGLGRHVVLLRFSGAGRPARNTD